MRGIAAGASDDELVFDDERRGRDIAAALARIVHGHLPVFDAGLLIECDDEIVGGAEEHFAIADGNAAILQERHPAGLSGPWRWILVVPEHAASGRIESEHLDAGRDQVHDAIDDDGRGLKIFRVIAGLELPDRHELFTLPALI